MKEIREIQAASLSERIRQIELVLKQGASAGLEFLLKGELLNQQAQLAEIRDDNSKAESRKEEKARDAVGIATMVTAETKLNTEEKLQYSELLKRDHFTRADVSRLDEFFAESHSKLSDAGKGEISVRLWKGIERGELEFTDLADETRKKEADFLYRCLNGDAKVDHPLKNMPAADKADFIRAYEIKDERAVTEVLNRESVSQPVGKSASTEADSTKEINAEGKSKVERIEETAAPEPLAFEGASVSPLDLSASPAAAGRTI